MASAAEIAQSYRDMAPDDPADGLGHYLAQEWGYRLSELKAPFPWFGGKARIADLVWERFGDVPNYVEPFAGSAAMLLARPESHKWWERTETINDADGLVANYWRATAAAPEEVAQWADWPVNENDLHARHAWLVGQRESLQARLEGDPDWYDAKVAGWWVWGLCAWIGSGWCSGEGPWSVHDGQLVHLGDAGLGIQRKLVHLSAGRGINRQLVHLSAGRGINRQLVHLGGRGSGQGINRQRVHLGDAGRGINRQLVHLGDAGQGLCETWSEHLTDTMKALSDRLRRVRVCCGDWSRVCGPTPTTMHGVTGVFLDPPYDHAMRDAGIYTVELAVSGGVRDWAVAHGDDPMFRIALCGYLDEHEMPEGWRAVRWKAHGGYGNQGESRGRENAELETVWFSPHCLAPDRMVNLPMAL